MTQQSLTAIHIPVDLIDVSADHRKVHPDAAQALAENIGQIGLRSPIEVIRNGDRFRLVFGATRRDAASLLGWPTIPAFVKEAKEFSDEAAIRLVTIAENFVRRDLSVLDQSVDIAAWCAIYRAAQPGIKPGPKPKGPDAELSFKLEPNSSDTELLEISDRFAASFSDAARNVLNISRSAVFRAIKIAAIPADLRDRMALQPIADNQSELLALAAQPFSRQSAILDLILSGQAGGVVAAVLMLENQPAPLQKAVWEGLADRFCKLKPDEQYSFFSLHEAAILRWLAERQS